jgi:peptidyl-dipeptidase Dcp
MNNPLLKSFDTAPFSKIKNEHFLPAIKALIEITKSEIDSISLNSNLPTFKNTVEALAYTGLKLERATSIFFNLNSAETNEEIQNLAQEISPLLTDFKNDLLLNEDLFKRVKTVYYSSDSQKLTSEQKMLLEKQYKDFARNGANLSTADKEELRRIDNALSKLKLTFGENVLAETNKFILHITNSSDLSGLPNGAIEAASQTAQEKGKEGWIFSLDFPSYIPFMKYAKNRDLRKKLSLAFGAKGFHQDALDNQENVLQIVRLRHQRALRKKYEHFYLIF